MSIMGIVGVALWILVVIFIKVKINGFTVYNPLVRGLIGLAVFPFVGAILVLLGLLGLVCLAPLLDLFASGWSFGFTF